MEVKIFGKLEWYKLFYILEFDLDCRRMSVIVQVFLGEKLLFVKGVELLIFFKCIGGEIEKIRIYVDEFVLKGLRILCIVYRKFILKEYEEIDKCIFEVRIVLQQWEEKLVDVFQFIEKDLILFGVIVVEDRL